MVSLLNGSVNQFLFELHSSPIQHQLIISTSFITIDLSILQPPTLLNNTPYITYDRLLPGASQPLQPLACVINGTTTQPTTEPNTQITEYWSNMRVKFFPTDNKLMVAGRASTFSSSTPSRSPGRTRRQIKKFSRYFHFDNLTYYLS